MVRKKGKKGGSSAAAFRACSEQVLRIRIESITLAAEKNLTDDRLVDILITAFPESYSSRNRNLLAQRVAKITRLLHRKNDAVEEPSPVSKKRRKIDESGNSSSRDEVESSINSSSLSDSTWEYGGRGGADKSDADSADRREVSDNGVGEWSDGSGGNLPLFGDLRWSRDNFLMLANLRRRVILPLHHSKLVRHCGMEPTARILFHGPSGCGKTSLARAIANDAGVPFCEISASALVSGGSPEENIRKLFSAAYVKAPSILFIDELDAMTSRMGGLEKVTEARIVKQLKACMDEPLRPSKSVNHSSDSVSSDSESSDSRPGNVLFIGATKKIDALDPALRQWFDREIAIPVPGEKTRHAILSALMQDLKVEVDLAKIARCTPGFVGGDLVALVKGARKAVVDRTMDRRIDQCYDELMAGVRHKNCQTYRQPFSDQELENLSITMDDFLTAGEMVRPSSEMEGFCTTPKAKWDDVVGLHIVKSEFERYIIKPIKFPEVYKDRDDRQQKFKNFFLYGPPGCGKTLIVEALANRTGASYIHIKTGELLEYGDQSDFLVQSLINYARSHTPCILFFDELVNIPSGSDKKQWPQIDKLRSVLANEGNLGDVYVIGATNRVEAMKDIAWIGEQFDIVMRVPLPSPDERGEILKILARDKPVDANLDLEEIGGDRWYYSGRDLSLMMEKAVKAAIDRGGGSSKPWIIKEVDLMFGWDNTTNTVSRSGNRKYKRYHETYCSAFHKCFENEDSE